MYDGQSAGKVRLGKVLEIFTHLYRRQHTFIYNIFTGQGNNVKVLMMYTAFNLFTHNI